MDINITLIFEIISFIIFSLIIKKYFWPKFIKIIDERKVIIDDNIKKNVKINNLYKNLKIKSNDVIKKSLIKADKIIDNANIIYNQILDESKISANNERNVILKKCQNEIEIKYKDLKKKLCSETNEISLNMTQKILENIINKELNSTIIKENLDKIGKILNEQ